MDVKVMMQIQKIVIMLVIISTIFSSGCSGKQALGYNQDTNPRAAILASPIEGTKPLTVNFTGIGVVSNGTISSYHWDFGDGTTSNIQNLFHTYQNSGSYHVVLLVTDNRGNIGSDEIMIYVEELTEKPEAKASSDITSGSTPLIVTFSGNGIVSNGSIVSYHWDFGDGITSDEQNPSHTYTQLGSYTVILTVTDNKNATDDDIIVIYVMSNSDQSYKSSCRTDITYQQLNNNVNNYLGQRVTYKGTIVEVALASREFIVDIGDHDLIFVTINKNVTLIKNDTVQFWGEIKGYDLYISNFSAWQIRMPKVEAQYIEKNGIPGFELIIVIGAIALVFIWKRKSKK